MNLRILWSLMIVGTLLMAYDLDTWKKDPPALNPDTSTEFSPQFKIPDMTEPFVPPRLPSTQESGLKPLEGILPQVLPDDLPPPQDFVPQEPTKREFLISYKMYVKDGIAQGESYNISEPIQSRVRSGKYAFDYQCRIDTYIGDFVGDDRDDSALKIILEAKKDDVLDCLYKSGVKIRDDSFSNNSHLMAKTILTLPARTVVVYLDNGFLILEVWKEKR